MDGFFENLVGVAAALLILYVLLIPQYPNRKAIRKPPPKPILSAPSGCRHLARWPYDPGSSFGDESDYNSRCMACGAILREEPNRGL